MNTSKYVRECCKTENIEEFDKNYSFGGKRMLHAALGIVTEAAEFADIIKKGMFYNRDMDNLQMKKELGDILWYIAICCDVLEVSFEELFDINIKKLRERYPCKFTNRKNNLERSDI